MTNIVDTLNLEPTYQLSVKQNEGVFDNKTWGGLNQGNPTFVLRDKEQDDTTLIEVTFLDELTLINDKATKRKYIINLPKKTVLSLDVDNIELMNRVLETYLVSLDTDKYQLSAWSKGKWFHDQNLVRGSDDLGTYSHDFLALVNKLSEHLNEADEPVNNTAKYRAYLATVKRVAKEQKLTKISKEEYAILQSLGKEYSYNVQVWITGVINLLKQLKEQGIIDSLLS